MPGLFKSLAGCTLRRSKRTVRNQQHSLQLPLPRVGDSSLAKHLGTPKNMGSSAQRALSSTATHDDACKGVRGRPGREGRQIGHSVDPWSFGLGMRRTLGLHAASRRDRRSDVQRLVSITRHLLRTKGLLASVPMCMVISNLPDPGRAPIAGCPSPSDCRSCPSASRP